jgi:hypothetical protein
MGSIHPIAKQKIFEPGTCEALGVAFEAAWQRLLVSGSALASLRYADATREALAMHIVDLAQRGERDVIRLRDDAIAFVTQAIPQERRQADGGDPWQ